MSAPIILVTGGTGTLGRHVVDRLHQAGCEVRVLSRKQHEDRDGVRFVVGDLATGEGLVPALQSATVIVHCASRQKGDAEATRTLVRAAQAQPVPPHLVYISIVGIDRVPFGYYRTKLAAERIIAESGLPWSTLRATQFHDLVLLAARVLAKPPVVLVPAGVLVQPVDADEVAARLVELALDAPAGRVPDLGGPEVADVAALLRAYLGATGSRRPVLPVRMPATRALRAGGLVLAEQPDSAGPGGSEQGGSGQGGSGAAGSGPGVRGRRTWAEFLAERVGRPADDARPAGVGRSAGAGRA